MPYLFPKPSSLVSLAAVALGACASSGDGVDPKNGRVYFPVGLVISKAADHLLVVNSDFDLQFSQGTVQSLNLSRVREVLTRPCSNDSDCDKDEVCDVEPSQENDGHPAFVCVEADDPSPCGAFGDKAAHLRALAPGRCAPIELLTPADGRGSLLTDVAHFSAFATQGLLLSRPCGTASEQRACGEDDAFDARVPDRNGERHPDRLFIPVRGDTSIHYLDVRSDGRLVCNRDVESQNVDSFEGASGQTPLRCDGNRVRSGRTFGLNAEGQWVSTGEPPLPGEEAEDDIDEDDPFYDFELQPEPLEIAGSASGRVIVVSHQLRGTVSTLMNNWLDPPELIHVLRDLPYRPIGVAAAEPSPRPDGTFRDEADLDFLVTYAGDAQIDLLHFYDDGLLDATTSALPGARGPATSVFRPSMVQAASSRILTNTPGTHSRGLLVTATDRDKAVVACPSDDEDCLKQAERVPLEVYVTNRTPNSMLLGSTGGSERLAPSERLPRIYDTVPLTAGPARIVTGSVILADGSEASRIFILCFDDAVIYVYDPALSRVESEIRTGRGPYAMAFDPVLPVAYVSHFTDSYIGAISLDQRYVHTYGATLATLGSPEAPRATGAN